MRSNLFIVTTLSFCVVACKPAYTNNINNIPNNRGNEKLSDQKVTEFTNVGISIGRIEELWRVMKGRGATWGVNDPVVDQMKTAIGTLCEAKFHEGPSPTRPTYTSRVMEFSGPTCPVIFIYNFEFQTIAGQRNNMSMSGTFVLTGALAAKNGVQELTINSWRGSYLDRRSSTPPHFDFSFVGSGVAKMVDGKTYAFSTHAKRLIGPRPMASGYIRVTTPDNFAINLEASGSGYKLNDRPLNKEGYEAFVAKWGLITDGFKALMEF